jgi:pimeloyl-ACP methyl ester carboxylesterase
MAKTILVVGRASALISAFCKALHNTSIVFAEIENMQLFEKGNLVATADDYKKMLSMLTGLYNFSEMWLLGSYFSLPEDDFTEMNILCEMAVLPVHKVRYIGPAVKIEYIESIRRKFENAPDFRWFAQPQFLFGSNEGQHISTGLLEDLIDFKLEVDKKIPGYWQHNPFPVSEINGRKKMAVAHLNDFINALLSSGKTIEEESEIKTTNVCIPGHIMTIQTLMENFQGIQAAFTDSNNPDALTGTIDEIISAHINTDSAVCDQNSNYLKLQFDTALLKRAITDYTNRKQEASKTSTGFNSLLAENNIIAKQAGTVQYFIGGQGKELILIINALGLTIQFWDQAVKLLMKKARVIIWQTRCCEIAVGGMQQLVSIDEHVTDIAAILQAEGGTECHLLSWCNGARIATAMAAQFPSLVASVIYLCPAFRRVSGVPPTDTKFEKDLDEVFEAALKNKKLAHFLSAYLINTNKAEPVREPAFVLSLPDYAFREAVVAPMSTGNYLLNYAHRTYNDEGYPLRDLITQIRQPVLFILGSEDAVVSNSFIKQVVPLFRQATSFVVSGASHYIQLQQPEIFSELVLDFITGKPKNKMYRRVKSITCDHA